MKQPERSINSILQYLDEENYEENNEEALVVVHPGFYPNSNQFEDLENLSIQDYQNYFEDVKNAIKNYNSDKDRIYVFYQDNTLNRTQDLIEEHAENIDYITTSIFSGYPINEAEEDYAEIFGAIQHKGNIELWGEMNGFCASQVHDSMSKIEQKLDKEINLEIGGFFPEKELDRTAGQIHWKDGKDSKIAKQLSAFTKI